MTLKDPIRILLDAYSKHCDKKDLAIFYFIIGNIEKVAECSNPKLNDILRTLEPEKRESYRKTLINLKNPIIQKIGQKKEWTAEDSAGLWEVTKSRRGYEVIKTEVIGGLMNLFASSLEKFRIYPKFLENLLALR